MSGVESLPEGGDAVVPSQVQRLADVEDCVRNGSLERWLREYESRFGAFTEEDLQAIAERNSMPYVPPRTSA